MTTKKLDPGKVRNPDDFKLYSHQIEKVTKQQSVAKGLEKDLKEIVPDRTLVNPDKKAKDA